MNRHQESMCEFKVNCSSYLESVINKVKLSIPEQGPLEFFVHHNTLHHLEKIDFFSATKKASEIYNTNAFMSEEYYWDKYQNQCIEKKNILAEIDAFSEQNNIKLPHSIIYRLIIQKETENTYDDYLDKNKFQNMCVSNSVEFYDRALRDEYGVEIDYIIAPHIFKFFSAYFDFGSAYWTLQNREKGSLSHFLKLYKKPSLLSGKYLKYLSKSIKLIKSRHNLELIEHFLKELKIERDLHHHYLFKLAYRYKGWMGLIKSLESNPEWVKNKHIKPCFKDGLAILILSEISAIRMLTPKSKINLEVPVNVSNRTHSDRFINHYIYEQEKHPDLTAEFKRALPYLSDNNRKEILHRAFERTFYNKFLDAYITQENKITQKQQIEYQVICCIDEREESLRRYLESDEKCQTFGTAGHFGLPITFKGYFDKHIRALCPVNVKPKFHIEERGEILNHMRLRSLFVWGEMQWISSLSSKTMIRGSIQSFFGFFMRVFPFTLDIVSPAVTIKLKKSASSFINQSVMTRLIYKKEEKKEGLEFKDRLLYGYNFLSGIGLTKTFGKYIFIMGHGSSSLNNPHEAAHDCGACGGGRGGPNARLMALILNDPCIRKELSTKHNLSIPENTRFIGCYHNTCSDDIHFYDVNNSGSSLQELILKIKKAASLDAKERSRRFVAIAYGKEHQYYHGKMQQRAIDLRQPRPEYGHATNAICIVGDRRYSKNLFLDRRAFLVSYDEFNDPDGSILFNTLNSVGPVCSGINLEYYFSFIDNEKYGCGTKLPHNVVSLIGVMNGYQSDLQLGLPWQMVEIHEPIRLCMHVICGLEKIQQLLNCECEFSRLVKNEWIYLTVHESKNDKVYTYRDNKFTLYELSDYPPSYFRVDNDIMNKSTHLEFGHISS